MSNKFKIMTELKSIPPSIWGHSAWKFLFTVAYVYPVQNPDREVQQNYYIYFTHLKNMLPCEKCRIHYDEYLNNNPLQFYLHNRESLFRWLLGLHNQSNSDNILTNPQQAIDRYIVISSNFKKTKCVNCIIKEK